MYPIRLSTLVATLLFSATLFLSPTKGGSQQKPQPEDTDNDVSVAAAVQVLRQVELTLASTKMKVSIEHAQQGTTVFLLPVWVVARVETFNKTGQWEELLPGKALPVKSEAAAPRLRVQLVNLLAQEDSRTAVEKRLREHLASNEGRKPEQFKLRSPTFNPRGFRIALAAPGATANAGEVLLSPTVVLPPTVAEDNGRVVLELLPDAIAGLQAATAEPVLLRDTYLKLSGQMKARFEKQQYLANFQAVHTALTRLQSDLKSIQPKGTSAPECFVQVPVGEQAEGKAAVREAFSQYLAGSISLREGAHVNPGLVLELTERILGRVLAPVALSQANSNKRVAVLLGNLATLSATVGEIKALTKKTKAERTKQLQAALDDQEARRTGQKSEYKESLGVHFGPLGGKIAGAFANATEAAKSHRRQQQLETLNRGLDELAKHFDGRLPTLTGIHFDQKALDTAVKAVQGELQQHSVLSGWSQHDWSAIKLTKTTGLAINLELLLRQMEAAQARYAESELQLGRTEQVMKELQEFLRDARKATEEARVAANRIAEMERRLKKLNSADGGLQLVLKGHEHTVYAVTFSPNGKTVATASADHTARLWDATTGKQQLVLDGHTSKVYAVAFSPDGKTVATASNDQTVRLWDAVTGDRRIVLKGHTDYVNAVAFSPDSKTLVTGSGDQTARLWDAATGAQRAILKGHTKAVLSVSFSPDGKTVVTGSGDHTAKLWDATTAAERAILKGHTDYVNAVSFSPDGKTIATASSDRTARLWDATTTAERAILKGHTDYVNAVAFSQDGKTVATGSSDRMARLWNATTGAQEAILKGHTNTVYAVSFSPDGKTVATGSEDNTARLWEHLAP